MPDISMCKDEDCIQKHICYRYTAIPSEYVQCYFKPNRMTSFDVIPTRKEYCEYFIPVKMSQYGLCDNGIAKK